MLATNSTLTALDLEVGLIKISPVNSVLQLKIRYIHSQGNSIGDEGAQKIAAALAINNALITLQLRVRFAFSQSKIIFNSSSR